jgi:hypothetical protein
MAGEPALPGEVAAERAYQTALAYLEQDVDGFIGASFAEADTGRICVAHSVFPAFALSSWVAASSEMLRLQRQAALGLRDEAVLQEIVVTFGNRLHLSRMVSANVFLFIAANRETVNLALMNLAIKSRTAHLNK